MCSNSAKEYERGLGHMGKLIAVHIPKIAIWGSKAWMEFPRAGCRERREERGIGHSLENLQEGDRNKWEEDEKEQFETSKEN